MIKRPREWDLGCAALVLATGLSLLAWQKSVSSAGEAGAAGKKKPAPTKQNKGAWKSLFDGKTMAGWKEAKFGGEGEVHVEDGAIFMEPGNDMTGITYGRDDLPKTDYELTLQGKRVKGNDFFCTTTFPVGDSHCSLVMGGWGGTVVGLSSIDSRDASENETATLGNFKKDQWYSVKIRVTRDRIAAWVDDKQVVDLDTKGKKISIRPECDLCKPLGIATWRTTGAVRAIRIRSLGSDEANKQPQ